MQHSWLDFEAPKGAPVLETSDVETSQKLRLTVCVNNLTALQNSKPVEKWR